MTPTFAGRVQSRLFAVLTAGLLWTLLITPLLPVGLASHGEAYTATLTALGLVALIGAVVWDPVYQFLQQFRWEKDWPAMFTLLLGIPEGTAVYVALVRLVDTEVGVTAFVIHFSTTWLVVFLCLHGPMRVVSVHWRFRGGRLV